MKNIGFLDHRTRPAVRDLQAFNAQRLQGYFGPGANFRHYRLHVTANNGGHLTGLSELLLLPPGPPQDPVVSLATVRDGVATCSAYLRYDTLPENAFDTLNVGAGLGWATPLGVQDAWLAYEFTGGSEAVGSYGIAAYNENTGLARTCSPNTWKLLGSNDGVTWRELHSVKGHTSWEYGQVNYFPL